MKKKSRFIAFVLSAVPGLAHLYLGWYERALVLAAVFFGICFAGGTISSIGGVLDGMIVPLTFFGAALVWFTALAEAMKLVGISPPGASLQESESNVCDKEEGQFFISGRRLIALALSAVPGAGHMFLGLLKPGFQLMAAFFFFLFIGSYLDMSLLAFITPVLWFFAIFDVYHLLQEEDEVEMEALNLFDWVGTHSQWLGWGLIALGILIIGERMLLPLVEHLFTKAFYSYFQTSLIALILIGAGIKLLSGTRTAQKEDEIG